MFVDTLNRTMVEPRRRCFALPSVDLKKHAVGGLLSVVVVSAQNVAKLETRDSRTPHQMEKAVHGNGSSHGSHGSHGSHASSNGNSHGSGTGRHGKSGSKFVELTCEDLTRKTNLQAGGVYPVWNEAFDMVLHDNTGTVHLSVYEQGSNNVKYDYLGCCEIKVRFDQV